MPFFVQCLTHVTVTDITPSLYLYTSTFARTADSVVIQHRLSVSLSGDPSGQHRSREVAEGDTSTLASAKAAPLMPFLSLLKNICPTKETIRAWWRLISACPTAALWTQVWGKRAPHTAAEASQTERQSLAVTPWQARHRSCGSNALTGWSHVMTWKQTCEPEQTETQRKEHWSHSLKSLTV